MDADKLKIDEEQLKAVMAYMKEETNDEDTKKLIWSLYLAAKTYLGVREPKEPNPLYDLAVWRLTLHYYDHRDAVGNEADFPAGLRPIINRLKADDVVPPGAEIKIL